MSCCAHRNILTYLVVSCLVHGDSSGAGGSSSCGYGGQSQPLAPPVAEVEAVAEGPCEGPKEASASKLLPVFSLSSPFQYCFK